MLALLESGALEGLADERLCLAELLATLHASDEFNRKPIMARTPIPTIQTSGRFRRPIFVSWGGAF